MWTWKGIDLLLTGYPVADEQKARKQGNHRNNSNLAVTVDASSIESGDASPAQPSSSEPTCVAR